MRFLSLSRNLALASALLAGAARADLFIFTNVGAFDGSSNTTLVEDFEARGVYGRDVALSSLNHNGISYTPHAGVPFPNVWVATPSYPNFGTPGTTSSILTGNGNEDFTMTFAAPRTAVGFDTYLNQYGPATIRVYGSAGLLGTFIHAHPANQVGFFGVVSDDLAITSVRWTTVNGGLINTGIDNIRLGGYENPAPVPEPSTWALLGLGSLLLLVARRKAARRA